MVEVGFTILSKSGKSGSGSGSSTPNTNTGFVINEDFAGNTTTGVLSATTTGSVTINSNEITGENWVVTAGYGAGSSVTQIITFDIPVELQGSAATLDLSFAVGDFDGEGNDNYFWISLDDVAAETTIVGPKSWAGPESTFQTFTDDGQSLPADAVKLRLTVRTTHTGAGFQGMDTRVDNIIAELV